MTKRIFRSICVVALAVLIGAVVVIMGAQYNYFTGVQRRQLDMQTSLAAQAVANEGLDYLSSLRDLDTRITWIAADGAVLFDSHSDHGAMENHLEREEVREALETGSGDSVRFSVTLAEQMVYTARRLPDGTVLRLSLAQYSVASLMLGMAEPIILILTAAVVLAMWLANRLSRSIVRPLNALNLDDTLANTEYEEIAPLLWRLDSQQRQLKAQETVLKRKQREFDAISNNMEEGLVLLNDRFIVLTMNPAAARLIGLSRSMVGINFFSVAQTAVMEEVLRGATAGKKTEAQYSLMGREYQVEANPVKTGGQVSGVVLLILDITEKHRAETQRREFTANVSHELKTPLHSISGYAELMKTGLVRSEDTTLFADRIYTEAQRLIRLVEDILRLSRLDEDADADRREPVDLYILAREAMQNMEPTAQRSRVTMHLTGGSTPVIGSRQQLYGLVLNLCSNAIKYNRPEGRVDVDIRREEGHAVLTVADTGIGIAPEHHGQIFQRFYRVDKSHSKAVGGTGLGLSIVKHAALNHNAKIELESQEGKGTTIRVIFPA